MTLTKILWIFLLFLNFSYHIQSESHMLNQTERHASLLTKGLTNSLDVNKELLDYVIKLLDTAKSYFIHVSVENTVSPVLADAIFASVSRSSSKAIVVSK